MHTWSNTRGAATQMDYVFVTDAFSGHASTSSSLSVKTDHLPIDARISLITVQRERVRHCSIPSLTGWQPKDPIVGLHSFRHRVSVHLSQHHSDHYSSCEQAVEANEKNCKAPQDDEKTKRAAVLFLGRFVTCGCS